MTYLIAALAHLDQGGHRALDVRSAAQAAHTTAVQDALATTVYNTGGCTSYYFTSTGRNTFAWPWSTGRLVRRLSRFDADAYTSDAPARPFPARSDKGSRERRAAMTWCPIPRPHHWELHDHLIPGTGPVRSLPTR